MAIPQPLRRLTAAVVLLAILVIPVASSLGERAKPDGLAATEPVDGSTADTVAGLYDTLTKGLMARRSSEFKFIAKVVAFVKAGKLTRKMVLETFHWARRKVGLIHRQKYPYPYFKYALIKRAAAIGVKL